MTKPNPIAGGVVLVAIDVAKSRNEVLIHIPGHARRRRLIVLNTKSEHDRLVTLLADLGRPVACGFEATGNYHRPIAWRLLQAGFDVRLVSSLALARTREALHNGWDKNDPKDAQVILHMLTIGASQRYHDPLAAGINAVLAQQDERPPIAEPLSLLGEIAQLRPQFSVRRSARAISDHLAIRIDDGAGPPFRQAYHGLQMRDAFALVGSPYHFLQEAHAARLHQTSTRPGASSASRSGPQAASAA